MKRTLYVDVSYLVHHPYLNTGIQRVVRRVVEHLPRIAEADDLDIVPVDLSQGQFRPVHPSDLYSSSPAEKSPGAEDSRTWRARLVEYLGNVYLATKGLLAAVLPHGRVQAFLYAPTDRFGLDRMVMLGLVRPMRLFTHRLRVRRTDAAMQDGTNSSAPIALPVAPGDVLLLLDSTWYSGIWPSVERARQGGVRVVSVIYDLIPITHPRFCDEFLVGVFKSWFNAALVRVDGFITISHTVQTDLQHFLRREFGDRAAGIPCGHFLLGADFDGEAKGQGPVRPQLEKCMRGGPSPYLIVSTVEPRKNHAYLLDAFEQLWGQGYDVTLVIVGRVGWKVEALLERIKKSPQFGSRLFLWNDLSDTELRYCYEHSKALLFPSIVEGFGLPIVEGLANGLPVFASDTPVHREVGGDQVRYFDLARPGHLADYIVRVETEGMPEEWYPPPNWRWLDWHESSRNLYHKVMAMAENASRDHAVSDTLVPASSRVREISDV